MTISSTVVVASGSAGSTTADGAQLQPSGNSHDVLQRSTTSSSSNTAGGTSPVACCSSSSGGGGALASEETVEALRKELERLKLRLEEERKKLNDVPCKQLNALLSALQCQQLSSLLQFVHPLFISPLTFVVVVALS